MDKAGVCAAFQEAGLSRVVKDIDALVKPSIRVFSYVANEAEVPIGASKLGGTPDLPAGVRWPERNGLPQAFLGQLRLDKLHPYDVEGLLPSSGMLWFFYDAQQETYGADPKDRGGWSVLFDEGGDPAQYTRTPWPERLPAESRFHACTVNFANEMTLPEQPELELAQFDWSKQEIQQYETLLANFPTPADHGAIHHRMLGHPNTLQDDMRLQCQLVSNGMTDEQDPRAQSLKSGAKEWQLLLQVDSDEHAGMQWGSSGMLYYWIRAADLHAKKFDTTWVVLQSD